MFREHTVVYEHPEYGEAYVTWRWVHVAGGSWTLEPVCVEFGFFVPPEEVQDLTHALLAYRLKPGNGQGPWAPPTDRPWTPRGDQEQPVGESPFPE